MDLAPGCFMWIAWIKLEFKLFRTNTKDTNTNTNAHTSTNTDTSENNSGRPYDAVYISPSTQLVP